MLSVEEIADIQSFSQLGPRWTQLASASSTSSIFQTYEWNAAWLRHLGSGRLLVLAVTDGPELVGIAPLVIRRPYGLPLRRLQFMATGPSDYLGVVAAAGREAEVWSCTLQHVLRRRDLWDVVDLQQVPESSAVRTAVHCLRGEGVRPWLTPQAVCPYLPLPGSKDAFMASLGSKTRWNLRYYERVLRRDHEVAMERVPNADLASEMEELFRLHSARWRTRWLPGVLAMPATRRFHREVAESFARAGWLRLFRLTVDGATAASLYCFSYGGKGYYYLGGFDPRYAKMSVGTLLTGYAIGEMADEGCREMDFLRGGEAYKYRWGCRDRTNQRLTVVRPGIRACLARSIVAVEQWAARAWESRMHSGRSSARRLVANPTRNMER